MKKYLVQSLLLLVVFVYTGCSSKDIKIVDYMKQNQLVKSEYQHTKKLYFSDQNCPTCKDEDNGDYECSMNVVLNKIAKDSLKKGFLFFTVTPKWKDNPVSFNYKPINSLVKVNRYCNEVYYDKESGLEDDKCHPIGFGEGYPENFNVMVNYYKKRNPLFPVWSAKKTISETQIKAIQCMSERPNKPLRIEYKKEELE